MNVKLLSIDRHPAKEPICLTRYPVFIGRSEEAEIQLVNPLISRLHCEVSLEEGRLIVRDLESSAGTLVNLQEIDQAELQHGDLLTVGPYTFRLAFERLSLRARWRRFRRQLSSLFHRQPEVDTTKS